MKQEGRPAEQVAKADCEYPIECDINEYKKGDLPQCRSPFIMEDLLINTIKSDDRR